MLIKGWSSIFRRSSLSLLEADAPPKNVVAWKFSYLIKKLGWSSRCWIIGTRRHFVLIRIDVFATRFTITATRNRTSVNLNSKSAPQKCLQKLLKLSKRLLSLQVQKGFKFGLILFWCLERCVSAFFWWGWIQIRERTGWLRRFYEEPRAFPQTNVTARVLTKIRRIVFYAFKAKIKDKNSVFNVFLDKKRSKL